MPGCECSSVLLFQRGVLLLFHLCPATKVEPKRRRAKDPPPGPVPPHRFLQGFGADSLACCFAAGPSPHTPRGAPLPNFCSFPSPRPSSFQGSRQAGSEIDAFPKLLMMRALVRVLSRRGTASEGIFHAGILMGDLHPVGVLLFLPQVPESPEDGVRAEADNPQDA